MNAISHASERALDRRHLELYMHTVFKRTGEGLKSEIMDYPRFTREAWPILNPITPLIDNWHIDCIGEYLMAVMNGQILRLIINIPPRNLKSTLGTVLFPAWGWTRNPSMSLMFCSYASRLATKHSTDRRTVIESPWYRDNWGNRVRMAQDQNQKDYYKNTAQGQMLSTSVGGSATGMGADGIIMDDMLNPQNSESEAERKQSKSMYQNVLSSRLNDPKKGFIVLIEQRTHDKDLTGIILSDEPGVWTHLKLPLISEKKTIITFPISGREFVREAGSYLNEERQGEKQVKELKNRMGTRTFSAQAQQDPASDVGNIFNRDWWRYWTKQPDGFDLCIQSWDLPFKKTSDSSYVCGGLWMKRGSHKYLIDLIRDRMTFTESLKAIIAFNNKWPQTQGILIEDKANGPAIIDSLNKKLPGIIPVNPLGTKLQRAVAVSPQVEAGNIWLPAKAVWVSDYIEEHAKFKGIDNEINDQVDMTSQALSRIAQLEDVMRTEKEEEEPEGNFLDSDVDPDNISFGVY